MTSASSANSRTNGPAGAQPLAGVPSPESPAQVWSPWLLGLLQQQLDQYQELERLSREQSVLVASGRTDDLISLLGRRQDILDRLSELGASAAPFRDRWATLVDRLSAAERERFRAVIEGIDAVVAEVNRRDEADRLALERERTAIADEMAGVTHTRGAVAAYAAGHAAAAYGSAGASGPRFQDRRG